MRKVTAYFNGSSQGALGVTTEDPNVFLRELNSKLTRRPSTRHVKIEVEGAPEVICCLCNGGVPETISLIRGELLALWKGA